MIPFLSLFPTRRKKKRQDELAADKSRIQIRNNNDNLINLLCYIN